MSTTTQSNEKPVPLVALPVDLRDYFAGQALPMLIEFLKHDSRDAGVRYVDYCAQQAYATADAMLKARQQ